MPNWCWNNLTVSGDEKELQDFVEKSTTQEGRDFSFNGTFPMNDDLDISAGTHNTDQEEQRVLNKGLYGHSNWYDWRISEWGTKWDADEAQVSDHNENNYFHVSFQTAWAPPIDWLKNIAMDYPNLEFELEYDEEGMGFGGTFTIQGDDQQDAQWDTSSASDCCNAEVYDVDDKEYTLPEVTLEKQMRWVNDYKSFDTIQDVPEHLKYPDYQCSICGEETEVIMTNVDEIKSPIKKTNELPQVPLERQRKWVMTTSLLLILMTFLNINKKN